MAQQNSDYPLDYTKGPRNAGGTFDALGAEAQQMAEKIARQAQEYGEKAQEVARNFKPFVEKSMKQQPMGTLTAAAVIGFVLGALWKK
jgi:ElaB/YqjD/DUF883 family membrane-anchored ribosome-binding protein